jgi:hypothetical protein
MSAGPPVTPMLLAYVVLASPYLVAAVRLVVASSPLARWGLRT